MYVLENFFFIFHACYVGVFVGWLGRSFALLVAAEPRAVLALTGYISFIVVYCRANSFLTLMLSALFLARTARVVAKPVAFGYEGLTA